MSAPLPWEDDALSDAVPKRQANGTAPARGQQLSVAEIAALGLPVDDPFWMLPEVFDAMLAERGEEIAPPETDTIGPDAPACQPIRQAIAGRAPLPSLAPRKRCAASAPLPEAVRRAVVLIAIPRMPDEQTLGAAHHLLNWYEAEYEGRPTIADMVLWWWKAARREVDIRAVWTNEMRAVWTTTQRSAAPDPTTASVNAFYGYLAHHAACVFIRARGHNLDDDIGRELLRSTGFPPPDKRKEDAAKRILTHAETRALA